MSQEIIAVSSNCQDFGLPSPENIIGKHLDDWITISAHKLSLRVYESRLNHDSHKLFACSRHVVSSNSTQEIVELVPEEDLSLSESYSAAIIEMTSICTAADMDPDDFLKKSAQIFAQASGFDSVMIYVFDRRDGTGSVRAEVLKNGTFRFLGLRFPASDVPLVAREMFVRNKVRQITDVQNPGSCLICDPKVKTVDLSDSILRGASSCHLQYLKNMGVSASFSVALIVDQTLFGLVAAHHYHGEKRLPLAQFETFRILGSLCSVGLSASIARAVQKRDMQSQTMISSMSGSSSFLDFWDHYSDSLRQMLRCSTVALFAQERCQDSGSTRLLFKDQRGEHVDPKLLFEACRVLSYDQDGIRDSVLDCDNQLESFSQAASNCHMSVQQRLSGCSYRTFGGSDLFLPAGSLFIPCSVYFLLFLRPEVVREITWAGKDSLNELSQECNLPRESFEAFLQQQRGHSEPWTESDLALAEKIRIRANELMNQEFTNKELNRAMETAVQKSAFLAHMSHELRTPFNGILGMLDSLRLTSLTDDQREMVDVCFESAEHMLGILDDVLLASKIDADQFSLTFRVFDLVKLCRPLQKFLQMRALQSGNSLSIETNSSKELVVGDPGRVRQVLLNLLSNALKFTRNGRVILKMDKFAYNKDLETLESSIFSQIGQIFRKFESHSCSLSEIELELHSVLRLRKLNDLWFLFRVIDSGIGISSRVIKSLFSAFQQGNSSTERMYQGTGLGLFICKQLVSTMGGMTFCVSTESKGSCFSFLVPFETGTLDDTGASPESISVSTSSIEHIGGQDRPSRLHLNSHGYVVIADDNEINRKVFLKVLHSLGIDKLVVVHDGKELLDLVTSCYDSVACVITDIHMPHMDGFQASTKIREFEKNFPRNRNVPVLAVTADVTSAFEEKCVQCGISEILPKPITKNRLTPWMQKFGLL
jgi:light-regulated signal transduction histidine kinase (bacteriophytochrome)